MIRYALVFALNFAVEFAVEISVLHWKLWRRIFLMALPLNLVTHPLLWFFMDRVPGPWLPKLLFGEVMVFGTEIALGLQFFRYNFSRARVIAAIFCANLATFLMTFLPSGL